MINFINKKSTNLKYTRLEYIEATGTQYIDTKVKGSGKLRVEMSIKNEKDTTNYWLLGSRDERTVNTYAIQLNSNWETFVSSYNTNADNSLSLSTTEAKSKMNIDKNKGITILTLNNTSIKTKTEPNVDFVSKYNMFLFAINNAGELLNGCGSFKLYYCRIYDNDVLIRDFIPAKDSNGVVCLLDKVTNKFYYNQGTNDFIAGEEIQSY